MVAGTLMMTSAIFGEVRFSSGKYDFGTLREDDGPVTGKVTMTNLGPGPTYIRNVRTTCGCTDATFTEGIIEEGDSATVTFTYDPLHRPGSFSKTVKVFVGQDNKMHTINIKGNVLASRKTLALNYPDSIGVLRLSTLMIDGGDVPAQESRNYFVKLYNPTDRDIRPVAKTESDVLSIAIEPQVIQPGATAVIGIYLNSRREQQAGDHVYEMEICDDADASLSETGRIALHALIRKP